MCPIFVVGDIVKFAGANVTEIGLKVKKLKTQMSIFSLLSSLGWGDQCFDSLVL